MTETSTISGPGDRVMLPPASVTFASLAIDAKPSSSASRSETAMWWRKDERQQRKVRDAAHRGDVADVDRQCLVADVFEGGKREVEVDAFDERIGRQDLQRSPNSWGHRRIVAKTDRKGARLRAEPLADSADEPTLAKFAHRRRSCGASSGRTQRRASPG